MESQNNLKQYGQCRCCLSMGNHRYLDKEYYINGQREVFMDIFMECFNLFLSTEPSLPTQICAVCETRLRDAHSFRRLVLENERILLEALQKTSQYDDIYDPLLIKSETASLEDTGDEDCETKNHKPMEVELKIEPKDDVSDSHSVGAPERDDGISMDSVEDMEDLEGTPIVNLRPEYEVNPKEFTRTNPDESEDMISGEKKLLQRFSSVQRLPTRNALADICPRFVGHLEALKGHKVSAKKIQDLFEAQTNRIQRRNVKKFLSVSEKMAYALNATTILENSNATVFKSKMRSGFPCFYCKHIYDNPKQLRDHQTEHPKSQLFKLLTKYTADSLIVYADVTDLKCTICNENIPCFDELKEHLVEKHEKKLYKNVTDRVITFELGDKESNYNCKVCGVNFETFGAIDRHMNVHYKNYVCDECGTGFITKHRLKVHSYRLHDKKSVHVSCDACRKIFPNRNKYKIHYKNVHQRVKKMKCPKCSESFVDYFTRQRHLEERHGMEPIMYKCTECEKSFNRKYSLSCHFKRLHLVKKDLQCEFCPFMCFSRTELTDHKHKHFDVKSFVCTVCKKSFMRKKTLSVHMRIHTNDIRYSCHMCGETFVQNWRLQSHLKMHKKEC